MARADMATPVATPARKIRANAFTKAMGLGITAVPFGFERTPLCVQSGDMWLKKNGDRHVTRAALLRGPYDAASVSEGCSPSRRLRANCRFPPATPWNLTVEIWRSGTKKTAARPRNCRKAWASIRRRAPGMQPADACRILKCRATPERRWPHRNVHPTTRCL